MHADIQKWNTLLRPQAVPFSGRLGRAYKEPEDTTRFPFQRDRDRIIHTQSFRRLKGKTQVFVAGTHDHVRTRLTHTMEVAQISRDIARHLRLNEDLAECIALAHDLGHPPFGHTGEAAIDSWMQKHGGSFEHNRQSHRIVTILEEHCKTYTGLNLNLEVLQGLLKHETPHDDLSDQSRLGTSLEAAIVNLADEIAYTGHDTDDGLRAGLFSIEDIMKIPLAKRASEEAKDRGTQIRGSIINILVRDLYAASGKHTICFSGACRQQLDMLRNFLWQSMYLHPRVREAADRGKACIVDLCVAFEAAVPAKVLDIQQRTKGNLPEAIKDYVAGMTDTFAMQQWLARESHAQKNP
jgi:dGTPase